MKEAFRVDLDCPNCEAAIGIMVRAPEDLKDEPEKLYIPQAVGIYANGNYDPAACIGTVCYVDGGLEVTLFDGMSMNNEEILEAFGNHIGVDPVIVNKDRYTKFIIRSYMIKTKLSKGRTIKS